MKKLLMISVLAVSMPLASVTAKDLLVDPKKPGAYATLQAAVDAASPGDRVLLRGPVSILHHLVINKSLTIESVDHTKQEISLVAQIQIKSLTIAGQGIVIKLLLLKRQSKLQ